MASHTKRENKSATEAIKLNHTVDNLEMVKSNFKAGDWVVRTNGESFCNGSKFAQIQSIELDGEMCYLDTGRWLYPSEIRLWTINDAQDGDVLVASDGSIFIFAGVVDCACKYYATLAVDNDVIINKEVEGGFWETSRAVHPATQEQRNRLFAKMKEAGYIWDSDKKKPTRRIYPYVAVFIATRSSPICYQSQSHFITGSVYGTPPQGYLLTIKTKQLCTKIY